MKMVTLTRDMRPWRKGDRVPVPDNLAEKLLRDREAEDPAPFGAAELPAPPPAENATPMRPAAAAGFATRRKR